MTPVDAQRHCPSCGRGPFFLVVQRVPAGARFRISRNQDRNGPDAGLIRPAAGEDTWAADAVGQTNADPEPWMPGHTVELGPDSRWRRIR